MTSRTAFHLDCNPVLAECGCTCARCLEEMKTVFGAKAGVSKFYPRQAAAYLDDLRAAFALPRLGIAVIRARRTVLTDLDVGNTLEISGSRITMR
jgi:hypothetical protein